MGSLRYVGAVALLVWACGDDEGSRGSSGGPSATSSAQSSTAAGTGGSSSASTGPGGQGSGGSPPGDCSPATLASSCGKEQSIVRIVATGVTSETTGTLRAVLAHYYLGQASAGGVFHTDAAKPGVTLGAGDSAELELDMCLGSAMWQEENCDFNLWVYLDANNDGVLDAGEPAGRTLVQVSCNAAGAACAHVDLSCTSGMSCAAFQAPAGACACSQPACSSDVATCQ